MGRVKFCAICVSDIVGAPREFEGMTICADCDSVELPTSTPERFQRGYANDGGIGHAFMQQLAKAARELVPARVRKLVDDTAKGVPPPRSADWRSEYDPRDRFNGLSDTQAKYLSEPQSRNRSGR